MRRLTVGAAITTVAAALIASVGLVAPAQALSAGVAFSADGLPTWQTNGTVYATQAAGSKVLVGGNFTQVRPPEGQSGTTLSLNGLVVLDADSGAPTSCQFQVASGQVRGITLSPDGNTAYIVGSFARVGNVTTSKVAALDLASCTVKSAFKSASINSMAYSVTATSSALYVSGQFTSVAGQPRSAFAALDPTTGALLPWVADATSNDVRGVSDWGANWDTEPPVNGGYASTVSPDGRTVVLGGDFDLVNGVDSHAMVAVDATTGAVVKNFPMNSPFRNTSKIRSLTSDGTQFYTGNEGTGPGQFDGRSAWRWSDFTNVFMDTCLGATQAVLVYQGTLYSASHAHDCSSVDQFGWNKRNYFLAERTDSPQQLGWYPQANDGIGEGIGPRALTVATGTSGTKYLYSGGDFTKIGGKAQQGITRFSSTDSGTIATPQTVAVSNANGQIEVRFRTSVDNDDDVLTYRVYRDGSTTPFWTGTAQSMWWNRPQVSVVDTGAAPGTQHSYRVTASDGVSTSSLSPAVTATASGGDAYGAAVLADKPSLFWRYDEAAPTTWAQDASQASSDGESGRYDGAAPGGPSAIGTGTSATFDGSNDYIAEDKLLQRPDTFTIETWFNTTTKQGGKLVGFGNGRPRTDSGEYVSSGSYDDHVYMDNDGYLTFGVWNGGAQILRSPKPLNDGQWHQVTASMGAAGMALYIDGVKVASNGVTSGLPYKGIWKVGGDSVGGWPYAPSSSFFQGQIDETAIYSAQLTAKQVVAHYSASGRTANITPAPADAYGAAVYNDDPSLYWRFDESNGVAKDSSMNGANPGNVLGGVRRDAAGVIDGTKAYSMTGAPDSLVVSPSVNPTDSYSVEAWFQTTTTSGGKIVGHENAADGNGGAYDKHLYMNNGGQVLFGAYAGYTATIRSSAALNDGKWHHVVGTQGPDGMRLYVDGQLQGSNTERGHDTSAGFWRVGGGNLNGWPDQPQSDRFTGKVDEVAVYSTALSQAAVTNHYKLAVNDTVAPSAPSNVTSAWAGNGANLSWAPSSDNVSVTGYRVYRGTTADFAIGSTSLLGTSTSASYSDATASLASPYYAVTAIDGSGNESSATRYTLTGQAAPTDAYGAAVYNDSPSLYWRLEETRGSAKDSSISGANPGNVLRGVQSGAAGIVSGTSGYTMTGAPDSLVVAPRSTPTRDYTLETWVQTTSNRGAKFIGFENTADGNGSSYDKQLWTADSGEVRFGANENGNLQLISSTTRVNDGSWHHVVATQSSEGMRLYIDGRLEASNGVSGHEYGDGYWRIGGGNLAFWPQQPSSDRFRGNLDEVAIYAKALSQADVTNHYRIVTSDAVAPTTPGSLTSAQNRAVVNLSWTASTDNQAVVGYRVYRGTTADFALGSATLLGTVQATSYSDTPSTLGATYYAVTAIDGAGNESTPARIQVTVADTTAPSTPASLTASAAQQTVTLNWQAATDNVGVSSYEVYRGTTADFDVAGATLVGTTTGTTFTENSVPAGRQYYKVVALDAAGNRSAASSSASVDSVAPDTTAPSTPASLTGTVDGGSPLLSWTASTDNVGVTGYTVHRGTAAGFTPSASNQIASVTTTSYKDSATTAAGTYYYAVVAGDAAGNRSTPATTSVTLVQPSTKPTVVSVVARQDTMVASTNASYNYGATNQLSTRGNTPIESYLEFQIPQAPAGTRLNAVSLKLRTSNDSTAGSNDAQTVKLLNGTWSETSTTWANKSVTAGATLGQIASVPAVNTAYSVSLDASALSSTTGLVSFALTATGTDNARFFSKDQSNAAFAPTLVLEYLPVATSTATTQNSGTQSTSSTQSTSPAAPTTSTVSVDVSEDSFASATDPNTAQGASTTLISQGTGSATSAESFLKLALPAAPSGARLTGASLQFRTTDDSGSGSAGDHVVSLLTGTFAENDLRWANRPTQVAAALGTIRGASAPSTAYSVALDVAALAPKLGSTVALSITTSQADDLKVWSREAAAGLRPVLVLTYSY